MRAGQATSSFGHQSGRAMSIRRTRLGAIGSMLLEAPGLNWKANYRPDRQGKMTDSVCVG
jgi:hypothetical protein